jgi:hypothetical protein
MNCIELAHSQSESININATRPLSTVQNLLIPAQNETVVRSILRSVLSVPFGATGTDDFGTHPCLQPFRTTETKKDGDKYREINGLQVTVSAELFVYYLGHRPPRVNSE